MWRIIRGEMSYVAPYLCWVVIAFVAMIIPPAVAVLIGGKVETLDQVGFLTFFYWVLMLFSLWAPAGQLGLGKVREKRLRLHSALPVRLAGLGLAQVICLTLLLVMFLAADFAFAFFCWGLFGYLPIDRKSVV